MQNIGIVSLGCPKNLVDTENIIGNLKQYSNIKIVSNPSEADTIIVNTCGFIQSAKEEAIETILEMANYKKTGRLTRLIVIGCLAQRYKEEIKKSMPEVDLVFGVNEYDKLLTTLVNEDVGFSCEYRFVTTPKFTAYLKISDGCDNRCTYCAIPMIRGSYRSRPKEDIIFEAKKLVQNGAKELVLVAQDTTRYGIDLYGKYCLPDLLKELCKIEDVHWIRILYAYPELVSDELIDVMKAETKICNYIDIPLQHINDDILRRMNRRTNKAQICNLLNKLRKAIPDVILRTSLISGFPGETEEQANELEEFVKEYKFDRLGVFAYSQEENTPAAKFENQVEDEVKEGRKNRILKIQQKISKEKNEALMNKEFEVLIVEKAEKNLFVGRSYMDTDEIDNVIYIKSSKALTIGEFYKVKITSYDEYDLYGEIISK